MYKNIETDEFMYPILDFDNFSISRSGKVAKCLREPGNCDIYQRYIPVKPHVHNHKLCVKFPNKEGKQIRLGVAELNLKSIYGDLPFKIGYVDSNPMNVDQSNLYYIFSKFEITDNLVVGDMEFHNRVLILSDDKGRCEVFKPLPNEYIKNDGIIWVSSKGVIFDFHRKCLISRSTDNRGYYKIGMFLPLSSKEGAQWQPVTLKVHSLVYAAWVDFDLRGMTIDHLDGRRHNNDVLNLEKVTQAENVRRAHDRNLNEPNVIHSKWTTQQVHLVCKMLEQKCTYKEIAEALGIDTSDKNTKEYKSVANLCAAIRDGRTYKDIVCQYNIPKNTDGKWESDFKTPQKFDKEIIRKICEKFVEGYMPKQVIDIYPEIPSGTIYNIKTGKQYRDVADTVPGMDEVINSRARNSSGAISNGLNVPVKLSKEEKYAWRNAERKRLRAAGINREAAFFNTPWPELLPEAYKINHKINVAESA